MRKNTKARSVLHSLAVAPAAKPLPPTLESMQGRIIQQHARVIAALQEKVQGGTEHAVALAQRITSHESPVAEALYALENGSRASYLCEAWFAHGVLKRCEEHEGEQLLSILKRCRDLYRDQLHRGDFRANSSNVFSNALALEKAEACRRFVEWLGNRIDFLEDDIAQTETMSWAANVGGRIQ